MLFSAYRRDDFNDPEGFVTQLGVILCDFPSEVVEYITSPRTGIQRRSKWPPTINEIIEACEQHQEHLARLRAPRPVFGKRLPAPLFRDRPQGSLANVFVPEGHPRYAALVKWTGTEDPIWWKYGSSSDGRTGLWVSLAAWETAR